MRQVSQRTRTDSDVFVSPRFGPLLQVATFAATEIEHLDLRTGVAFPSTESPDQHRLDPVVESLEANDGRVDTSFAVRVGSGIICVK